MWASEMRRRMEKKRRPDAYNKATLLAALKRVEHFGKQRLEDTLARRAQHARPVDLVAQHEAQTAKNVAMMGVRWRHKARKLRNSKMSDKQIAAKALIGRRWGLVRAKVLSMSASGDLRRRHMGRKEAAGHLDVVCSFTDADPVYARRLMDYYHWQIDWAVTGHLTGRYAAAHATVARERKLAAELAELKRKNAATKAMVEAEAEAALLEQATGASAGASAALVGDAAVAAVRRNESWASIGSRELSWPVWAVKDKPTRLLKPKSPTPPKGFAKAKRAQRRGSVLLAHGELAEAKARAREHGEPPAASPRTVPAYMQAKSAKGADAAAAATLQAERQARWAVPTLEQCEQLIEKYAGMESTQAAKARFHAAQDKQPDVKLVVGLQELRLIAQEVWSANPAPLGALQAAHQAANTVGDGWVTAELLRLLLRYAAFFSRRWVEIIAAVQPVRQKGIAAGAAATHFFRQRLATDMPTADENGGEAGGDGVEEAGKAPETRWVNDCERSHHADTAEQKEEKRLCMVLTKTASCYAGKEATDTVLGHYSYGQILEVLDESTSSDGNTIINTSTPCHREQHAASATAVNAAAKTAAAATAAGSGSAPAVPPTALAVSARRRETQRLKYASQAPGAPALPTSDEVGPLAVFYTQPPRRPRDSPKQHPRRRPTPLEHFPEPEPEPEPEPQPAAAAPAAAVASGSSGRGVGWVRWSASVNGISAHPQLKHVTVQRYTVVETVSVCDGPVEAPEAQIVGEYSEGSTIEVVDVSAHHDPHHNTSHGHVGDVLLARCLTPLPAANGYPGSASGGWVKVDNPAKTSASHEAAGRHVFIRPKLHAHRHMHAPTLKTIRGTTQSQLEKFTDGELHRHVTGSERPSEVSAHARSHTIAERARRTLWLGGLQPELATEAALRLVLKEAGPIDTVHVRIKEGKNKNWALVTFEEIGHAEALSHEQYRIGKLGLAQSMTWNVQLVKPDKLLSLEAMFTFTSSQKPSDPHTIKFLNRDLFEKGYKAAANDFTSAAVLADAAAGFEIVYSREAEFLKTSDRPWNEAQNTDPTKYGGGPVVTFGGFTAYVAKKRVADAFLHSSAHRKACFPDFDALERDIMQSRRGMVHFLERLAGAQRGSEGVLVPVVPKVLEPEETACASAKRGHSRSYKQLVQWTDQLSARATRKASARKSLATWAGDIQRSIPADEGGTGDKDLGLIQKEARAAATKQRERHRALRSRRRRSKTNDLAIRLDGPPTQDELVEEAFCYIHALLQGQKATVRSIMSKLSNNFDGGEEGLECDEFCRSLRQGGVNPLDVDDKVLRRVFDMFDEDANGSVTTDEFVAAMHRPEQSTIIEFREKRRRARARMKRAQKSVMQQVMWPARK